MFHPNAYQIMIDHRIGSMVDLIAATVTGHYGNWDLLPEDYVEFDADIQRNRNQLVWATFRQIQARDEWFGILR